MGAPGAPSPLDPLVVIIVINRRTLFVYERNRIVDFIVNRITFEQKENINLRAQFTLVTVTTVYDK